MSNNHNHCDEAQRLLDAYLMALARQDAPFTVPSTRIEHAERRRLFDSVNACRMRYWVHVRLHRCCAQGESAASCGPRMPGGISNDEASGWPLNLERFVRRQFPGRGIRPDPLSGGAYKSNVRG